jgi:RND family efflux transporter MFP subunit
MKRVVAVSALVLTAGAAACSRSNVHASSRGDVPSVAAAPVTRADLAQVLAIAAEFKPYQEIDVHAKVAGYLKPVTVDVGDHVKEGQLLAVLEVPELQNQMAEDEASIAHANDEITRAQSDLDRANYAHDVAHVSATRLAAASKDRPKLIAQQDLDDAEGRDRQAEAQIGTATAALSAARSQLAFAKANQEKTRTLLSFARITAPFTGVITRRYADTGALIQAGTSSQTQTMPLVRLSQVDTLRLSIAVPESAVPQIHLKGPVTVRVPATGRTFPGEVSRFADRLDPETRTMLVEVDVPNPTGELMPGMNATASIVLRQVTDALTVPIEALDRSGAQPRVFVVADGNRVEPTPVTVDLETADRAAITGAVSPGALVVIGNRDQLKSGSVVAPKTVATASGGAK